PSMEHQGGGGVAVDFSPDGKMLATSGEDGVVRLWQTATGKRLPHELKDKDKINIWEFNPQGKTFLTVSNATAQLWDLATGERVGATIRIGGEVSNAVFSPDGETFFTASQDGVVRLWELATGKQLREMPFKLQGGVSALAISPEGKVILTESAEGVQQ